MVNTSRYRNPSRFNLNYLGVRDRASRSILSNVVSREHIQRTKDTATSEEADKLEEHVLMISSSIREGTDCLTPHISQ